MIVRFSNAMFFDELFAGVVLALLTGLIGLRLARRLGWLDVPGSQPHKKHQAPTPLAGGITQFLALVIAVALFGFWKMNGFLALALPALVVFGFGCWDDARKISPRWKIVGQIIAAVLFMILGEKIRIIKPDFLGFRELNPHLWLNWLLTILWLVGVTNAFNFVDSMDGLASGIGATSLAFFLLAMLLAGQTALAQFVALLLGISFGLLFYNAPPARFFLGDSGTQTLGFLLAGIAILYQPPATHQASSWFVPILIMGIPILDTTLVVLSRLRRGKPVYQAGMDHTYHRLVAYGLEPNRAVLVMITSALLLNCLAFIALSLPVWEANLIFGACLVAGAAIIHLLDSSHFWKPTN